MDGVSLTVNRVVGCDFEINVIPHTLEHTTIKNHRQGTQVNLEVDIIARYLERLLLGGRAADPNNVGMSREFLVRYGYIPHK